MPSEDDGIIKAHSDDPKRSPMALIDVEDLIGRTFKMEKDNSQPSEVTTVDAIKNHQDNVQTDSIHTKFRIKHTNDDCEELLTHNKLMDHLDKQEDGPIMWELTKITSHQGPLNKNHPNYQGSPYNVEVLWENGERTQEPLSVFAADAPIACTTCAKKKNLLDKPG